MESNVLSSYLDKGIERIVRQTILGTFSSFKEIRFLIQFASACKKAKRHRRDMQQAGIHIPVFLISSITHSCNLYCKGCYARENGICHDGSPETMLSAEEWASIFSQAKASGICFNILAGGEPLKRPEVLLQAAKFPQIVFPVFTNGTLVDNNYLSLFDQNRNLVPIISLEGTESATDSRRGVGVYQTILTKMEQLRKRKILFGTSITVTTANVSEVTSKSFIKTLKDLGSHIVFFIEYVPVSPATRFLAFTEKERSFLEERQEELAREFKSVLFLSFPGDENKMGGCLAAGRGFFHINPYGAAEACPFSPYSDRTLRTHSLLTVLDSPFFQKLQTQQLVGNEHLGGCALFEQESRVKELLNEG